MSLIKITFKGAPTERGMRSKANAATRLCMLELGLFWKSNLLKKHFTPAGAREYQYQNRTKGYMIRKAKKRGNQNPLMWTGKSLAGALANNNITATATATRARVRVPIDAPTLNRMGKNRIDMAAEVTAVSDGDTRLLSSQLQQSVNRRFTLVLE